MKKLFSIFLLAAAALIGQQWDDYVGPYTISMNGQNYAAMCVDFLHQSSTGTTWAAHVNTSSDYSKLYHSDRPILYAEKAYL
jgi:hypothetical protein